MVFTKTQNFLFSVDPKTLLGCQKVTLSAIVHKEKYSKVSFPYFISPDCELRVLFLNKSSGRYCFKLSHKPCYQAHPSRSFFAKIVTYMIPRSTIIDEYKLNNRNIHRLEWRSTSSNNIALCRYLRFHVAIRFVQLSRRKFVHLSDCGQLLIKLCVHRLNVIPF